MHQNPARFAEFDALDLAMQTLRFMCWGSPVPNVLQHIAIARTDEPRRQHMAKLIQEGLDCLASDLSDRAKLQMLHGTLIPDVVSPTYFRNRYYAGPPFVFAGLPEKMDAIREDLEERLAKLSPKE